MKRVLVLSLTFIALRQNEAFPSDDENAQLPRLFLMDDQDRCLLQKNGLYCLGEFDLKPIGYSQMYQNIKKYSADETVFNRSRLYRGYCVSKRCPQRLMANITIGHATQRFEQCVQQRTRRHALTARLRTLKYCTTHEENKQKMTRPLDAIQQLFLQIVCAILVINLTCTLFDILARSKGKSLISAWSIRSSWYRLVTTYDEGDPRLKKLEPIQGIRGLMMLLTVYAHSWVQHYEFYVTSPQNLEKIFSRFDGFIITNGMSMIQGFVLISNFLTAYSLLLFSEKRPLKFMMLPVLVFKRIIRIAPTHLFLVGFAATYWPSMRTGASSAIIGEWSAKCRRKFWTHVVFVNNIVDKEDMCLPTTWFLPVDMHLFILSCVLTILMSRRRHLALRLYAILFVTSAALCGVVAYIMDYRIPAAFAVSNTVRGLFQNTPSFTGYYISTWGSLPACFLGLFCAHLNYELQQRNYDMNRNQWLKRLHPWLIPAMVVYTYVMGVTLVQYKQRWVTALCVALDRPIFSFIFFCALIGAIHFDGFVRDFFKWRGWTVISRLSLPMMMCHWIISMAIAGRPVTFYTSAFDVSIDYLGTLFYGYLMSLPVSLMVEIPVQRFLGQLL